MRVCVNRIYSTVAVLMIFLVGYGNAGNGSLASDHFVPKDLELSQSLEEVLKNRLQQSGHRLGFNTDRNAFVAIGCSECSVPNVFTLDESKRFKIIEEAFLRALTKIAYTVQHESISEKRSEMSKRHTAIKAMNLELKGIRILEQAETLSVSGGGVGGVYSVAVAVVWSQKLQQTVEAVTAGKMTDIPRFSIDCSLEDWIQTNQNLRSMLGVRLVFDSPNHFWILGIASQNDGESSDSSELHARAVYAADWALGGILTLNRDENTKSFGAVTLKPFLCIPPRTPEIRWIEQRVIHPMNGRHVKIAIAAIPVESICNFVAKEGKR